ncbi:toluene tolerance [Sandaracinus amylolyticus]|uniref:Toluene tolerance n=1 Tax=Sandaracinus amylolyticus TaxID=927083 RepID=A0A0F6W839_9BACT|nr:toluene tolerance [Sandaracinus amylolyticus]
MVQMLTEAAGRPDDERHSARDAAHDMAELMDFDAVARRALGQHWDARTPEERRRVATLLRARFERNYARWCIRSVDYEIVSSTEAPTADGVDVTLVWRDPRARGQPGRRVVYGFHAVDGRWQLVDTVVEGSSLVGRLALRVAEITERDGWDGLLTWLEGPSAQ